MKWIFIFCVALIACKQPNRSKPSKAELDSFVLRMNNKLRNELYGQPTLDPMRDYLAGLQDTVNQLNYDRLTLYWTLHKVQYFNFYHNQDTVNTLLKEAVRLSKSKDVSEKDVLFFYTIYNGILKSEGLVDSALKIANEAHVMARQFDSGSLAQTSLDLARIYQQLDDLPNYRKYIFEAWRQSEKEPELKPIIASGISYYYDRKNDYDSALYFIKQSETGSILIMEPQDRADNYANEAYFLLKKGKLKEGFQLQLKAKSLYDSLGIKDESIYFNLSETYGSLKMFGKAIEYLDSARFLAEQSNDYNMIRESWHSKASLYAKIPDYKKASEALDSAYGRYSIEIDSSLRQQARELEVKYSVQEKDRQINTLASTNRANLKIRSQQWTIIITIAVLAAITAFAGILLWRRRRTQMLLRETNLKQQLLRTQMDSHFLFNSLGLLQNLIRMGENEKAIEYSNHLARLMRFSFENASENFVPLKNEVDALESYLHLQQLYHPGLFTYRIELYKGIEEEDLYIPPMLLQPFVENAIHHGFHQVGYVGELTVSIGRKPFTLQCVIEDNGKGIQNMPGAKGVRSTGINQERLSILAKQTGVPAQLLVIDKKLNNEGSGTRIKIDIPFKKTKQHQKD